MFKRPLFTAAVAALAVLCSMQGHAQSDYPNKPVRVIAPYAAGGLNDSLARLIFAELPWSLKPIIEARPSANGRIAYEAVARSAPDGYTLALATSAVLTLPYLYKDIGIDPRRDFVPVTQLFYNRSSIVVNSAVPANNLKEFVAWVKANPSGKVFYGTGQQGNIVHMVLEMINKAAGISMTPIHYKGTADVNTALQRGDVQITIDGMPPRSITMQGTPSKVLAVLAADRRFPEYPDVPTLLESGLVTTHPIAWTGVLAPAGTPKAIVDRIAADIRAVLSVPAVAQKFTAAGAMIVAGTSEEFGQKLRAEYAMYGDLVKLVGIEQQ